MKKKKLEFILSIAAVITSIAAIGISVWNIRSSENLTREQIRMNQEQFDNQFEELKKHNKLSVKPMINIYRSSIYDKDLEVYLVNNGIGPARLNYVKIYYEDSLIGLADSEGWYRFVQTHPLIELMSEVMTMTSINSNSGLNTGEEVKLIALNKHKNRSDDEQNAFIAITEKMGFEACFCSLYDECWTKKWKGIKLISNLESCQ